MQAYIPCIILLLLLPSIAAAPAWGQDTTTTKTPVPERVAPGDTSDDDTLWNVAYEDQLRWRRLHEQTGVVRDTLAETQIEGGTVGGMVLNETTSSMGRRFYEVFYDRWEKPETVSNFAVRILERFAPGRRSLVEVQVDDETLFRTYLEPNDEQIRTAALRALTRTKRYLNEHYQPREVY